MAEKRAMVWVGRVISVLASLVFLLSASLKLKDGAQVLQGMAHLGLPERLSASSFATMRASEPRTERSPDLRARHAVLFLGRRNRENEGGGAS